MDKIYDELDEVKVEVEKLREESLAKTKQLECLRKAHVEQQGKIQQSQLEVDKLARELDAKSEEICEIRQLYEELQSSLHQKDLVLQQISSANEKIQAECSERILKLEDDNRDLVLALDEASARIQDLEKKACVGSEEIATLKRLLSIEPKKVSDVQMNASKDMKERDEYIQKLEEERRITEDLLKWKNEQFAHLEEAHRKLQAEFQSSKMEWEAEKSFLIHEITSVKTKLDDQVRVSENLETQLRMTNQALAHEESRRKVSEIQLAECRSKLDNVFEEGQKVKSEIEDLTMRRDEEVSELRMQLRRKEMLAKEMEHKNAQLEQENRDLLESLKASQEAEQTKSVTSASLKKLRDKLHGLEQLHGKCSVRLKEREANWNSGMEQLAGDLNYCLSELDSKNKSLSDIQMELEDCQWLLEIKNEEIFTLIMVLKYEFDAAFAKLQEAKGKLEMDIVQIEEKNMLLNQHLELKDAELQEVHDVLRQRHEEMEILVKRVESSESLKQRDDHLQEEVRVYKRMLKESTDCQHQLERQLLEEQTKREERETDLEMVNCELVNKASEIEKSGLKLLNLKSEMEEKQQAHMQEKASLVATVNAKDAEIVKLQKHVSDLESAILEELKTKETLSQAIDSYRQLAENKPCTTENLENEIAYLKDEIAKKESGRTALLDALNALEQESKKLLSNTEEKDQKIQELQRELQSLDQNIKCVTTSFSQKEAMLDKALKTAECQKTLEIEKKNQIIDKLEKETNSLRQEVDSQEKSLIQLEQTILQLGTSLRTSKSEVQELQCQLSEERFRFEGQLVELGSHKQAVLEDLRKASIHRENLLAQLEGFTGRIEACCREDVELSDMMRQILHLPQDHSDGDAIDPALSPSRKLVGVMFEERTPLAELNGWLGSV